MKQHSTFDLFSNRNHSLPSSDTYQPGKGYALPQHIYMYEKSPQRSHRCYFCSNVLPCEKKRWVNKGLTRRVTFNYTNKQHPFVKKALSHNLFLQQIQPLLALLFLITVSLVPLITPSLFSLLASCSLAGVLVLPKWPDPSQANSWKDAFFFFSPQFSSPFNPFCSSSTFSSNRASHLRLYLLPRLRQTRFQWHFQERSGQEIDDYICWCCLAEDLFHYEYYFISILNLTEVTSSSFCNF